MQQPDPADLANYWVNISSPNGRCGAGFLLTRRFVLTAAHCLRQKAVEDDRVTLSRDNGTSMSGVVVQVDNEHDVALIVVLGSLNWSVLPVCVDRCGKGSGWFAPYRPPYAESELKGLVLTSPTAYRCGGGATVEALELEVRQHLGSYKGYSGGPVEREPDEGYRGEDRAVVGMLIDQVPNKARTKEAANVLFAITVQHVMSRFDVFSAPRQHNRLMNNEVDDVEPAAILQSDLGSAATTDLYFSRARAAIAEIRSMVSDGLIPDALGWDRVSEAIRLATERSIDTAP